MRTVDYDNYRIDRQQKLIMNLAAGRVGYRLMSRERMLEAVALMHEFSATDPDVKATIAGAYALIRDMPEDIWQETMRRIPFPVCDTG